MKLTFACIAIALASVACFPVMAGDKLPSLDLTHQTAQTFQVQVEQVEKDMQKGGRFEYIDDDERVMVEDGMKFMLDLIAQNGTVAAMKDEDRIRLFNHQERVNASLTKNDSQRIICERTAQTGSLFKSTTCHTFADLEKRTHDSRDALERGTTNQTAFRSGLMPGH